MSSYLGFKEIDDWQVEWEKHRSEPECLVERDKRYGRVFDVFDEEKIYVVRVVLPQKPPHHPWLYQYGLPKHLKPYLMQAKIVDDVLLISGAIQDVDLAKLCGLINSFPDRFEIALPLGFAVKNLELLAFEDYIVDIKLTKV